MAAVTTVSVLNLSGDRRYEKSVQIKTGADLKNIIGTTVGLDNEAFELFKKSEAVLFDHKWTLSESDLKASLYVVLHPTSRDLPEHLKSSKEDMILKTTEEGDRALMSCGHAIGPQVLYEFCWGAMRKQESIFLCPAVDLKPKLIQCGKEWSFPEVVEKACLSNDERILFEIRLNFNKLKQDSTIRSCPMCYALSEKESLDSCVRMQCRYCAQSKAALCEFCWVCLRPWKTDNKETCGNSECTSTEGTKALNDILSNCDRKTIGNYKNVPSIRFCPKCTVLVEHTSGCKRLPCQNCKTQFCFVCLREWSVDGCGYGKTCPNVADVQTSNQ